VHTMIVTMTLDPAQRDATERHLREDVLAWAKARTGFVTGRWLLSEDASVGMGVVTFASAADAAAAAVGPRNSPPGPAWSIDSVEVLEQVAQA
jgi:hypothetical protein